MRPEPISPAKPTISPCAHIEIDVFEDGPAQGRVIGVPVLDFQHDIAKFSLRLSLRVDIVDLAPDHVLDQHVFRHFAFVGIQRADRLAVAQAQ